MRSILLFRHFIAAWIAVLGGFQSSASAVVKDLMDSAVDFFPIVDQASKMEPQAGCGSDLAASIPSTCEKMNTAQIAKKCLSNRTHLPLQEKRDIYRLPCSDTRWFFFFGPKIEQKIPALYKVGIEQGKIVITQSVHFTGLDTPKEKKKFRELFNKALPEVVEFFRRQGIEYRLDYSIDDSLPNAEEDLINEVALDWKQGRSHSERWHLGRYIDEKTGEPTIDFPGLIAHELLHRMGLPDDYVDTQLFCESIYGESGRNSERPKLLRCAHTQVSLCANVMESSFYINAVTLSPDSMYALIQPICPDACQFLDHRIRIDKTITEDAKDSIVFYGGYFVGRLTEIRDLESKTGGITKANLNLIRKKYAAKITNPQKMSALLQEAQMNLKKQIVVDEDIESSIRSILYSAEPTSFPEIPSDLNKAIALKKALDTYKGDSISHKSEIHKEYLRFRQLFSDRYENYLNLLQALNYLFDQIPHQKR